MVEFVAFFKFFFPSKNYPDCQINFFIAKAMYDCEIRRDKFTLIVKIKEDCLRLKSKRLLMINAHCVNQISTYSTFVSVRDQSGRHAED